MEDLEMALNLKLGNVRPADPGDGMDREWVGYSPTDPPELAYERNRGVWLLGRRVHRERLVTFSYFGKVVAVVELTGPPEQIVAADPALPAKQAIVGRVLHPGDPDHDRLIGTTIDGHRNPVTYTDDDPTAGPRTCACGCGAPTTGRRQFLPGHDQKAIHARISKEWGNTVTFLQWFDNQYGAPEQAQPVAV